MKNIYLKKVQQNEKAHWVLLKQNDKNAGDKI